MISHLSILLQCFAIGCHRLCLLPDGTQVTCPSPARHGVSSIFIFDHQFIITGGMQLQFVDNIKINISDFLSVRKDIIPSMRNVYCPELAALPSPHV